MQTFGTLIVKKTENESTGINRWNVMGQDNDIQIQLIFFYLT